MLKRLGEQEQAEKEEIVEEEVPDWLVDFKEEEDPQETAVLWLRRFVKKGKDVNVEEEIRRYTDELDSEEIPEWMEDLKKEEDPTSTAMLWLNRLEQEGKLRKRRAPEEGDEFDESSWIAELEKEQERLKSKEESEDFEIDEGGWLADLDREETVAPEAEKERPFIEAEGEEREREQEETPPWMLATSPLEGDDLTSDLTEEDDEEIPEWLAGYEDEEPEEEKEEAEVEEDEYAWLSAYGEEKAPADEMINLNNAAISQLESIIGISFQVAEGIVTYREEHGPYQTFEDLKNVPAVTTDQIIDILRNEVMLEIPESPVDEGQKEEVIEEKEKRVPPAVEDPSQAILQTARENLSAGEIEKALSNYEKLIEEKENIEQVIEDLSEATYDHPMNVAIIKTLGDAYMSIDKLQEALDAYSKAEDLLR
jgi:competence ComEA-like helix-hairpin-helix protein